MKFSLWCGAGMPWEMLRDEALHAESVGWDGLWLADHFMELDGEPGPGEALAQLAALAAAVPRVRIGPLVCGNTYRHPAILASEVAAIDRISGGRFVMGLGAGWQQNEHDAYGIAMPAPKVRLDMLEEACQIVIGLLGGERVTFEGEHYRLTDAVVPATVRGKVPLLLGGGGEKRTLKLVATYADEWNTWGTPEVMASKGQVLDAHCERVGRDPASIHRSSQALIYLDKEPGPDPRGRAASGTPAELQELMQAYVDAGVHEFIVRDITFGDPGSAERQDGLDRFLAEVAAPFRD